MAIHFIKPEEKRDWFQTSKHLAYFAFAASKLNVPGMAKAAENAAGSLKDMNIDQRAWCWLSITTQTALYALSSDLKTNYNLSSKELRDTIRNFAAPYLDQALEFELTPACLWNPADQPVLKALVADLPAFAEWVAPGVEAGDLTAQFRREAQIATDRIAQLDQEFYAPLEQAMTSLYGEGERRDRAWRDHLRWVRFLYEGKPTFSPDETETTSLAAVYQRLRCFWHEDVKDEEAEDKNAKKRIVHIGDLHGETLKWLGDESGPLVRVITGGPGSGKSSFARAFAMEAAEKTSFRIAFAELQHMSLGGGFEDHLESYFDSLQSQSEGGGKRGLPGGPLALQQDAGEPLLLIFDGLDELTVDEAAGREMATQFIQRVDRLTQKYRSPVIKAMVLGRNIACQEGVERSDLTLADMHHVAPLRPLVSREDIGLGNDQVSLHSETSDPGGLAETDQRPEYYQRWAKARGKPEEMPSVVTSDEVQGLNAEPLLLHLLLLSDRTEEEILDNPNHVYRDVFDTIHLRNQRISGRAKLDADDFDLLMECVALATWRGGGRTSSEADYIAVRALHAGRRDKKLKELEGAELKNVAIQFHARKGELGGEGFEFIHKSFSEYLVARALLRLAKTVVATAESSDDETALLRWVRVIQKAELTQEILTFLRNEARAQPDADTLAGVGELFSGAQLTGFPAHQAAPQANYREIETMHRCGETAMLAVIHSLGVKGDNEPMQLLPISWPKELRQTNELGDDLNLSPRHLLHRMLNVDEPIAGSFLSQLDLSQSWLECLYFKKSNLRNANLSGADLHRANFRGADLSEANLSGADLIGTELHEATLSRANLTGANLTGASLNAGNLNRADLSGADLSGADLTSAKDLQQEQINSAKGSKAKTKLPDHLTAPTHWDD